MIKVYTYTRYKDTLNYILVDQNFNCLEYVKLRDKARYMSWLKKSDYLTYDGDCLVEIDIDPDIVVLSLFQFIEKLCNEMRENTTMIAKIDEKLVLTVGPYFIKISKSLKCVTIEKNSYPTNDLDKLTNEDLLYTAIDQINEIIDFLEE